MEARLAIFYSNLTQWVKSLPAIQGTKVQCLGWEDPCGEGNSNLTLVFLPGEFHRQRSLVGYSPWGHKESDMTD